MMLFISMKPAQLLQNDKSIIWYYEKMSIYVQAMSITSR